MRQFPKQLFKKISSEALQSIKDKENTSQPICFIHIPKTAGTSFRLGAEAYFGKNRCLCDYDNGFTSKALREPPDDLYQFKQIIDSKKCFFYTGHINFGKASALFSPMQMITFIRNPIDQVISHFYHYRNNYNHKGELVDFVRSKHFRNIQSKALTAVHIELMAMVGITEQYEESLQLINQRFTTDIQSLVENTNQTPDDVHSSLDETMRNFIKEHNEKDVILYNKCLALLKERQHCKQQGYAWTHGKVLNVTQTHVSGWAFRHNEENAVELEILINGHKVTSALAKDNRPHLRGLRLMTRDAFVGFHIPISENGQNLKPQDVVEVKCVDTGQVIFCDSFSN